MNKLISTLLCVLLFVTISSAQDNGQYPDLPLDFSATVNIKVTSSMSPFPTPPVQGTLYYSYNQLSQRIDSSMFGQTMTILDRYDLMNEYQYSSTGQCECQALTSSIPSYIVTPGSIYQGQVNINGIMSDAWTYSIVPGVNITLYVDPTQQVLTEAEIIIDQMGNQLTTTVTFSNVQVYTISPSTFTVPSLCANSCPTPPPAPTPNPNACKTNSPPASCSCLSTPLNFCYRVTYPILDSINAQQVDQLVQQAYNNFVSYSQPSSSCRNNVKGFLCATSFPLCVGGSIPVLPCQTMCPLKACYGGSNSTCAAALPGSVCTYYSN